MQTLLFLSLNWASLICPIQLSKCIHLQLETCTPPGYFKEIENHPQVEWVKGIKISQARTMYTTAYQITNH